MAFAAKTGQALDRYLRTRSLNRRADSPTPLLGLRGPMTVDGIREALDDLDNRLTDADPPVGRRGHHLPGLGSSPYPV